MLITTSVLWSVDRARCGDNSRTRQRITAGFRCSRSHSAALPSYSSGGPRSALTTAPANRRTRKTSTNSMTGGFLASGGHSPRRCCWTPTASRAETSWATCRPDWAGARRPAGRTRRRRTKEICCGRRRPSSAVVYSAPRRPWRPRSSLATRNLRPTGPRCYRSDRRTSDRTNTETSTNKKKNPPSR